MPSTPAATPHVQIAPDLARNETASSVNHGVVGPVMTTAVLTLLTAIGLIVSYSESMIIPALPDIGAQYNASTAAVSWVPAIYLLVGAVSVPLVGKLGDLHGKKRMLNIVMLAYSSAVVLDGFSWNLESLLVFRAIQGLGLSMFPLAISLIHDEMAASRVPVSVGLVTSMNGVGSAIGLIVGAWITEVFGWQTNYHILAPFAVGLTILLWILAKESPVRLTESIDYAGISFLGLTVAFLLVAVSEGGTLGWTSATSLTLFLLALAFAVIFVIIERRAAHPLLDLKAPGIGNVLKVDFSMFVAGAVMFIGFYVAIYFAQEPNIGLGRNVSQAGLILAPAAILMLLFAPLGGRIAQRVGPKPVNLIGISWVIIGYIFLVFFHASAGQLAIGMVIIFAGVAFLLTSLSISILALSAPEQVAGAVGLNTSFRTIGQALGVAVAGAFLATYLVPGTVLPSDTAYLYSDLIAIGLALVGLVLMASLPPIRIKGAVGPVAA